MDVNEAYESIKELIKTDKKTLGLNTAKDMEKQAVEDPDFPTAWIWAAGAYALEGNKAKFSESLSNAAKGYAADISRRNKVSGAYQNKADAVKLLAKNADAAYDLVVGNLPKGSSKLELKEAAMMLFAKSIIENEILIKGGLEAVIEGTKNSGVIEDKGYMIRLTAGPLIFQAYDMGSAEGKAEFENGVNLIKKASGRPNLPTFLAEGIAEQPENNIGWYLTRL
jgi:hypothetical protein